MANKPAPAHATTDSAAPTLPEIHAAIACLQRLADAFARRREQLAEGVGLSDHQWSVLEEIATEHFMPSMFAKLRRSTAAAVSKTLRQLTDKGLVVATVGKEDARQRQYVLTARGKRIMSRLREGRQDAIDAVWKDRERADLLAFTRFGDRLGSDLERYAKRQETRGIHGKDAVRESV